MKRAVLIEINTQWNQCSDFIKHFLVNRFQAMEALYGKQDWLTYLADEFGLSSAAY